MSEYSIIMTDTIFPDTAIEERELAKANCQLILASASDPETLLTEGRDCDAMLVVYADVGSEVISQLTRCKIIVRVGIGYNNVDLVAATNAGIMVANVPDYCLDEVADHTMALFLSGIRKINAYHNSVLNNNWNATGEGRIPRLWNKKFGIMGCGAIGIEVAKRALSFGMEVIAYDPYASQVDLAKLQINKNDNLDDFLRTVDFLSLHTPLTSTTHHIIDKTNISKMKSTAFIINTSRGGLIKEDDLHNALQDGVIAGAALDVLEVEPPSAIPRLALLPNVIITPHAAFLSEESVTELRMKAAQEVIRTLQQGQPKFCVNGN